MTEAVALLRSSARARSRRFPALLARAEQLAGTVLLGEHGRRRAGLGDDFWQYRPLRRATPTARSTGAALPAGTNSSCGNANGRSRKVGAALGRPGCVDALCQRAEPARKGGSRPPDRAGDAILLIRGGERVGLTGWKLPPRRGMCRHCAWPRFFPKRARTITVSPRRAGCCRIAKAMFVFGFLGRSGPGRNRADQGGGSRCARGAGAGARPVEEESFPFHGRTIFEAWAARWRMKRSRPATCATATLTGWPSARTRLERCAG